MELKSSSSSYALRHRIPEILLVLVLIGFGIRYWYQRRVVMPESPSIVVMAGSVSGAADQAFLADAVANTLSAQMSGIPGIELKGPPTSLELEQIGSDYKRAAQAYGVNLVVPAAITVNGGQLELDLQVVQPVTRRVMWTGSFRGTRAQYLDLIHQAGEGLRHALKPSTAASPALTVEGGSEAELAYREGEYYLDRFNNKHDSTDFDAATKALERSLELNPKLANAAADIARLYAMKIEATEFDPSLQSEVQKWARRALDIDPRCGRAFFMLSAADAWQPSADPMIRLANAVRGAAFAPGYAPAHLDLAAALSGSANLGLAASRHARQLDPLYLFAPLAEAGYLQQLGRVTEAFAILDRQVVSIDPQLSYGRWAEVSLMVELGWLAKAAPIIKDLDSEERVVPLASNTIRQKFAIAQKQFGSAGLEVSRILSIVNNPKVTPLEVAAAVESVPTVANSGYIEDSLQILKRAIATGAVLPYDWLRLDRRLDRLRKEREFVPILERSRQQFETMLKLLESARAAGELPHYLEQPLAELRSQLDF